MIDQKQQFSVRRVVTGIDVDGKSLIEADTPSPHVTFANESGSFAVADLWRTASAPSPAYTDDGVLMPPVLAPTPGGSVFRVIRFPPDREIEGEQVGPDKHDTSALEAFSGQDSSIHPMMHRTRSIDYALILSGEIWAVMEKGETLMRAGDVLIQRATSHAWANRSDAPCIVAFILIDCQEA